MAKVVGKWEGGRVTERADGKHVYYLYKKRDGRQYEFSTGCTSLKPALVHWLRFQADPEGYSASGTLGGVVTIDAKLDDYVLWCESRNSKTWAREKKRYLKWWAEVMPGDVRRFTKAAILDAVKGEKGHQHNRLGALKAFCSWLRDVDGSLTLPEDASLTVANPTPKPAQWSGLPRAISKKQYSAVLDNIGEGWRCIIVLLAGTGMHVREANRVAAGQGSVEGDVVTIFHKSGRRHRLTVTPEVSKAAHELLARGPFNESRLASAIKEAGGKWAPGALRHSFISWKVAEGVPLEAISSYTNHSLATLRRHYNAAAIPMPVAASQTSRTVRES